MTIIDVIRRGLLSYEDRAMPGEAWMPPKTLDGYERENREHITVREPGQPAAFGIPIMTSTAIEEGVVLFVKRFHCGP